MPARLLFRKTASEGAVRLSRVASPERHSLPVLMLLPTYRSHTRTRWPHQGYSCVQPKLHGGTYYASITSISLPSRLRPSA